MTYRFNSEQHDTRVSINEKVADELEAALKTTIMSKRFSLNFLEDQFWYFVLKKKSYSPDEITFRNLVSITAVK